MNTLQVLFLIPFPKFAFFFFFKNTKNLFLPSKRPFPQIKFFLPISFLARPNKILEAPLELATSKKHSEKKMEKSYELENNA